MESENIESRKSIFEEGMEALMKRFGDNQVNRIILSHLYSVPSGATLPVEEIKQAVISGYRVPVYDSPKITLMDIFEKSMNRLERDGLIVKNKRGYELTMAGASIARLFRSVEAYAIFEKELAIEKKFQGGIAV